MLKDKILIVTGAAGGIGKAIAIEARRAGARVALVDVDAESLNESAATIRADGSEVLSLAVDITDRAVWQKSVDEIAEYFGGIDVIVNNAMLVKYLPLVEVN